MDVETLDRLAERVASCSLSDLSRATGLPYNTLKNVKEKKNVTWLTMSALIKHFAELDA